MVPAVQGSSPATTAGDDFLARSLSPDRDVPNSQPIPDDAPAWTKRVKATTRATCCDHHTRTCHLAATNLHRPLPRGAARHGFSRPRRRLPSARAPCLRMRRLVEGEEASPRRRRSRGPRVATTKRRARLGGFRCDSAGAGGARARHRDRRLGKRLQSFKPAERQPPPLRL